MPDINKQTIKARAESHSDVANSPATKAHVSSLVSQQFGNQLLSALKRASGALVLRNYREEWLNTDDGLVYELSVELEASD